MFPVNPVAHFPVSDSVALLDPRQASGLGHSNIPSYLSFGRQNSASGTMYHPPGQVAP